MKNPPGANESRIEGEQKAGFSTLLKWAFRPRNLMKKALRLGEWNRWARRGWKDSGSVDAETLFDPEQARFERINGRRGSRPGETPIAT